MNAADISNVTSRPVPGGRLRFGRRILVPLLLLSVVGCGPTPEARSSLAGSAAAPEPLAQTGSVFVHIVPYSQPGRVSLPVGGTLSVEMLSGMETGYVARLSSISPPGHLKAQREYTTQNDAQKAAAQQDLVGADVDVVFVFRAMKPGLATIGWRARRGDYDHGPDDLTLQVMVTSAADQ